MNNSWKSTVGGAFSAAGVAMVGVGVVPQLSGQPNHTLSVIAMIGFVCNVIGTFLAHLFAADASQLKSVQQQMLEVPKAIDTGDTSQLFKTTEQQQEKPKTP